MSTSTPPVQVITATASIASPVVGQKPAALPASRLLADLLAGQIATGHWIPGQRLPSERELAQHHHVARNTAREAIRLLAGQGLVSAEHGRGTFVRTPQSVLRLRTPRPGAETDAGLRAAAQDRLVEACDTAHFIQPAPAWVAGRLQLPAGAAVEVSTCRWCLDGQPLQLSTTHQVAAADGGAVALRAEVTSRVATPDESTALALPSGVAVLVVDHTELDAAGRGLRTSRHMMRGDQVSLDYRIPLRS